MYKSDECLIKTRCTLTEGHLSPVSTTLVLSLFTPGRVERDSMCTKVVLTGTVV